MIDMHEKNVISRNVNASLYSPRIKFKFKFKFKKASPMSIQNMNSFMI